ncbi:MAG: hypothetical protein ACOZNI_31275 [Myxococcota bacterium]
MNRLARIAGLSLLALALAHAPDALAGKKDAPAELPKIEATGIAEFDSVFMKAKAIHDSLDTEDKNLKEARAAIATALGVAEDAPLATALEDLKKKANGKIKVALKGATPRLEPSEAVPENVQKGIEAVNKLLDASEHAVATGKELVPQAKELATAVAGFPAKVPGLVSDPMEVPKKSKIVGQDVKATQATPDRIDRLVKTCEGTFNDVKAAFPQ